MSSICIVSCVPMLHISIRHGPTKGSCSRFLKEKFPPFRQVSLVMALPRFRFWVDYTMTTEKWPERFKGQAEMPEEMEFRIQSCF
jgi:hypothetical protein